MKKLEDLLKRPLIDLISESKEEKEQQANLLACEKAKNSLESDIIATKGKLYEATSQLSDLIMDVDNFSGTAIVEKKMEVTEYQRGLEELQKLKDQLFPEDPMGIDAKNSSE